MLSKVAFYREGSSKPLALPKPISLGKERVTKRRRVSKTIKSAEQVDTDDDQEEPTLMEFTSATSHVTQSVVASFADIEEIKQRRRRGRKKKKWLQLDPARKQKAILPPSPKTSSPPTFSIPISKPLPSVATDDTEIGALIEEPLEPHFPILPMMDNFDKLTEHATLQYKRFMDMIASGRAEPDQMKLVIVEKITIRERVITDLIADIDGSSKNARILRLDLDIVWNNCQGMKVQMSELLDTLKLEFNLMTLGRKIWRLGATMGPSRGTPSFLPPSVPWSVRGIVCLLAPGSTPTGIQLYAGLPKYSRRPRPIPLPPQVLQTVSH